MAQDDFQLVYQPVPIDGKDNAFDSALESVVGVSDTVEVVSPYLSIDVLMPLVNGRRFRLVTDQHACFESGFDPELFKFIDENIDCVRTISGLHAKVVIGSESGLFGSANLTTTGLTKRLEMASVVRGRHLDELRKWFEALWSYGAHFDMAAVAMQASAPRTSNPERYHAVAGLKPTGSLKWLAGSGRVNDALDTVDVVNVGSDVNLGSTNQPSVWIFQANPKSYRIIEAIQRLDHMQFLVNRYKNRIQVGDTVLLWSAGKYAGVYAQARVVEAVTDREPDDGDLAFWADLRSGGVSKPRVVLEIEKRFLGNPLLKTTIAATEGLEKLLILRQPNGTNFPVDPDAWELLHPLLPKEETREPDHEVLSWGMTQGHRKNLARLRS